MSIDYKNKGLTLLKKGQSGIIHAVFSRFGLILLMLVAQVLILFSIFEWFRGMIPHIFGGTVILTSVIVVYLLNNRINPTAKITWLIVILLLPVFGVLLFVYTQSDLGHRVLKEWTGKVISDTKTCIRQDESVAARLEKENGGVAALAHYIGRSGCHPVFHQTAVTYFPLGEDKFEEMLRQLEGAGHFIFMEYFILKDGYMWREILRILEEKARAGVEVRVMYDGTCALFNLPYRYPEELRKKGIQCKMFSPIHPIFSTHYNNRDHRKITVIDGKVGFTGGINIGDEYINRKKLYGHWKDTAVMLEGDAVQGLTLMFLQMWNVDGKTAEDYAKYLQKKETGIQSDGFVMPYGDSPFDEELVGETVYMDILNRAKEYVHIMSPYLIIDQTMMTALTFAAKRGVDVKLILPHIPDKKFAFALAKSHYRELITAGVRIFEYTPGFVHAKVFTSDGEKAAVGTINLDYRSLYLHFECAAFLYRVPEIARIEEDFQATLEKCQEIRLGDLKKESLLLRAEGWLLKVLAPLM